MRGTRRRSSARSSRPKRDVTWGFRAFFGLIAGGSSFSEWVAAPGRADPDPDLLVPNVPLDSTLIRTIPIFSAECAVPSGSQLQALYLGLIMWGGTDAATPPVDFPDPRDGAWDWIWRAPVFSTSVPGAGASSLVSTLPAPVWTDIHAQRKFGQDLGLLLCVGLDSADVDYNFMFDVRYAVKLPW